MYVGTVVLAFLEGPATSDCALLQVEHLKKIWMSQDYHEGSGTKNLAVSIIITQTPGGGRGHGWR